MNNPVCHICLNSMERERGLYHDACCKSLFGSGQPPKMPYTWEQLNGLAEQIIRANVTVPGVQAKLSLHLDKGGRQQGSRFTLVGLEGGYILKPPVEEYPEMPELEHLTMRMAGVFGIQFAKCGLIPLEDGKLAYITKRMDRDGADKLHMEDMCQLTDRLTEQKYRGSMEQVGKAVLRHCSNPLFDALRLFELALFCFLTGNSDMHLKNFSLLYRPGGEINLSPAYDLLPTTLLLPSDLEETALTLNGKKKRLGPKDFMRFAESLRLTEKQVANAYSRFSGNLPSAFRLLDNGCCSEEMKERYRGLIKERSFHLGLLDG